VCVSEGNDVLCCATGLGPTTGRSHDRNLTPETLLLYIVWLLTIHFIQIPLPSYPLSSSTMPALPALHAILQRSLPTPDHFLLARKKVSSSKKKRPGVVYVGGTPLETWKIVVIVLSSILAAVLIASAIYWYVDSLLII
jgi:hypothetical protein